MDKEPNKSSSELYREERKAKLAKAQEKKENSSKTPSEKKVNLKATGVVAIVLVVAIVSGFLINFFGVPKRMSTAMITSDGTKVSVAEFEYYYRYFMNSYHSTSAQYEQAYAQYYGEGAGVMMTGYDSTKTPENQKYKLGGLDKDKYGKNPTWADYFENLSLQSCYMNRDLAKKATEAGLKFSKADQKELDSYIEDIRKNAAKNDYSLDAYLRENFGKGINESMIRELFTNQTLAEKYTNKKHDEFKASVSNDVVLKEYEKNKDNYDVCDIRMFTLSSTPAKADEDKKKTEAELKAETKKAADEIKANAQNMFDGVKDEASFISQSYAYATESSKEAYKDNAKTLMANITKENIKSNISEDASKWAYEDTRVVGDKKLFTVENEDGSVTCYAIYLVKPQYRDETLQPVDVRHILVAFDPDVEDGKEVKVTDELKAEKLKQAEALLEKWKSGKATEKSFGDLAKKSSDDTGTAEKGGLIKDITKSSQYVKPFLDWCFVNDRKAGNTGIVESTYGYHIMYCSNVSDKPEWQNKIISSLVDKKNNDFFNNYIKKAEKKIVVKEKKIEKVKADMEKIAGRMISNA